MSPTSRRFVPSPEQCSNDVVKILNEQWKLQKGTSKFVLYETAIMGKGSRSGSVWKEGPTVDFLVLHVWRFLIAVVSRYCDSKIVTL